MFLQLPVSRRDALRRCGTGLGMPGLASLFSEEARTADDNVTNLGNTVSPNPADHAEKTTRNVSGTVSTGASLLEWTLAVTTQVYSHGGFLYFIISSEHHRSKHGKSRADVTHQIDAGRMMTRSMICRDHLR